MTARRFYHYTPGMGTCARPRAIVLACFILAAGCSHTNPYFRPGEIALDQVRQASSAEAVRSRILLVGDAGEPDTPVLDDVSEWASRKPEETIVLYLGDNMYPEGMTERRRGEADARLLPQIEAVTESGARGVFLPGNHDWARGDRDEGYDAVVAQARYVNDHMPGTENFLPKNGCPGPAAIDLLRGIRIIALDTQWWLQKGEKPTDACPQPDREAVVDRLVELLNTDLDVVVAAHHPLGGHGRHSGFSDWKDHLLPPIIGTVIALSRKLPLRDQDFNASAYRTMVDDIEGAFSRRGSSEGLLLFAAGHEHSLQVLEGNLVDYVLISGSAAKTSPVSHGDDTLFAHLHTGFMVVDFMESGSVLLRVIEPEEGEVFNLWLRRVQSPALPPSIVSLP